MEKVVRTEYDSQKSIKDLEEYLKDGWRVKMCNGIRNSMGCQRLEYIITKETEEDKQRIRNWFSKKNYIPCSTPPVKIPPPPRKSEEAKPPELLNIVTGSKDSLRSGMVFECRDKMRFLTVERAGKLYAISNNGVVKIEDYNEDLTYPGEEWADVMYIWVPKYMPAWYDTKILDTKGADWSRTITARKERW